MIYHIQGCVINTERRTLEQAGQRTRLTPKLFRLLLLFIESGGQVVTKHSIVKHVWQGQLVCETTVYKLVQRLRTLLGDDGDAQTVIQTIHGEGYLMSAKQHKTGLWTRLQQVLWRQAG
jgi:DNA-binding winged helix-turn-helix (wHTH) protein